MNNVKNDNKVAIFFSLMFITIVILGTIFVPITPVKATEQISQACGASGIIIRSDSSIIIDGWRDYSANRMLNTTSTIPSLEGKDAPSAIHLGKNLVSKTPVCFEDILGSHCVALEVLRKVK